MAIKRINQLTEAELIGLTEDEILKLIDYECAMEGVPMLPSHPGAAPTKPTTTYDVETYEVAGFYMLDSEHAKAVLAALNSGPLFKEEYASGDYNTKYLKAATGYNLPSLAAKPIYSPEMWDKIKGDAVIYATKKAAWDEINQDYTKALELRKDISEDITTRISEANDKDYRRTCLSREYQRYLELAEGDAEIALKFLEKVKDLSEFPELREEFLINTCHKSAKGKS